MAIYVCGKKTGELTQIAGISKFPADYGTRAEFEAKKDDLPDGTVFTTIDEFIESIRFITGEIKTYAGIIDDTHPTPTGWLLCDGSEVSKETYSSLYTVIGDSYGVASDTTKFKLPDLRGRFLQGADENLGEYIEAGLPNITGSFVHSSCSSSNNKGSFTGFSATSNANDGGAYTRADAGSSFNASEGETKTDGTLKTSSDYKVYGKSDTVQPPACTVNYLIKY